MDVPAKAQSMHRACMRFIDYLLIYFCISTTPLGALVPQFRLSISAQKLELLCIPLRLCSDSLWLLLKASGGLLTVHFESSPMSDDGKPPPNLQVSLWPKGKEEQMLKRRERERKIRLRMVQLGREYSIHGNPSHLTATPAPWRSKIKIHFPPSCISSYELYRMIFPTKSNLLAPPVAGALVPTEGNTIMMAWLSNVLLDRTHTKAGLTRDVQVPLKHIRELQPCLQSAWLAASLAASGRQTEQLGSHMWRGAGMGVSVVGAGRVKNTMGWNLGIKGEEIIDFEDEEGGKRKT